MVTRLRLSGFRPGDLKGSISIDPELLMKKAADRIVHGWLRWSDIRFLDNAFRTTAGVIKKPDGSDKESWATYLYGTQHEAGRRLFSILTGRAIYYESARSAKVYGPEGWKSIRVVSWDPLVLEGGMSFPNSQGLYYYLQDSKYGQRCRMCIGCINGYLLDWKSAAEEAKEAAAAKVTVVSGFSGHPLTPVEALDKYCEKTKINDDSDFRGFLAEENGANQFDKNDVDMLCVLVMWALGYFKIDKRSDEQNTTEIAKAYREKVKSMSPRLFEEAPKGLRDLISGQLTKNSNIKTSLSLMPFNIRDSETILQFARDNEIKIPGKPISPKYGDGGGFPKM